MIVKANHKGIYERILSDKNGQLVRVCFAVVEINGALKGQVISVEPVLQVAGKTSSASANYTSATTAQAQICLPISIQNSTSEALVSSAHFDIPSPYFFLDFFNSQPTRAPSFI